MTSSQITSTERRVRLLFRVSLVFKGIFSALEIIGGIVGYFISQHAIVRWVTVLTQEELTKDPDDMFAQYLRQAAGNLSLGSQHFAAFYLLSHGVIKTFLIVGLLRGRLAYYPLSLFAFVAFVVYQLFRFQRTHSAWLLVLTVVDIAVIALTAQEYRYLRRRPRSRA